MRITRGSQSIAMRRTAPKVFSRSARLRSPNAPSNTVPIHAARMAAGPFPVSQTYPNIAAMMAGIAQRRGTPVHFRINHTMVPSMATCRPLTVKT